MRQPFGVRRGSAALGWRVTPHEAGDARSWAIPLQSKAALRARTPKPRA